MTLPAPWTSRPIEPGEWEFHDGTRVRALLQKRPGPSGWTVHRIGTNGRSNGCDSFRSRAEAEGFITDGRIFRVVAPKLDAAR